MPITETRFSSTSTTSATLEGKYLGESSNISLKLSSLLFKDFKRTVNDAKTPCRIWQLINTPQLQLLFFAGFVPVKQERVKEANEFSRLTRPCWVEGRQPWEGFMIQGYPPQMGWATPCTVLGQVALWTGPNTTLTDKCTVLPHYRARVLPSPALCHCCCSATWAEFTALSGELARSSSSSSSSALKRHWLALHCTALGTIALSSTSSCNVYFSRLSTGGVAGVKTKEQSCQRPRTNGENEAWQLPHHLFRLLLLQ